MKLAILLGELIDVGIRERLKKEIIVLDGAMGTMLQKRGLGLGQLPELLNIERPDLIKEIHRSYIDAGAQVITTNSFGANEKKLEGSGISVEEAIGAAVRNAKEARQDNDVLIALDLGPIGELLEPMGTLTFEEAYRIFERQVVEGVRSGVDLIIIETMTDLYEMKAAILAVKENSDLAVFATMTFEENRRTFTGVSLESMVMTLEGLGVDALGVNCSLGPKELEPIIDRLLEISSIPVMVQANAGLPDYVDGETVYNIKEKEFRNYYEDFVKKGVRIIGGCCGSDDKYIGELADLANTFKPREIKRKDFTGVCSPSNFLEIQGPIVVGERINPTGKKIFKEALENRDLDYIIKEAISQAEEGAHILDLNLGLPGIDEASLMEELIKGIQAVLDLPLQIDSTDPKVIEAGLRVYNGKALVNSVNGEEKSLETILPLVKKYGAGLVGLTLDQGGIPLDAKGRFNIAKKIVERAEDYGIKREDIYIDCLTLTAAAQQKEVSETLKAMKMVKDQLGVKTTLGVSNISFGLPNRELINRTFLGAALYAGLDLAIINPGDREMMDIIGASRLLWNQDQGGKDYIANFNKREAGERTNPVSLDLDLYQVINRGLREEAEEKTRELLLNHESLDLVNKYIMPALDDLGKKYEDGTIFLPQLIQAAETVKLAFGVIKEELVKTNKEGLTKGKIILATVKGDIHDIGKNIVKVLLENYNYQVYDLGKDVDPERIVEEAKKHGVKLVGLSALMTTTVESMEETISLLKDSIEGINIMVGGAVLDEDYAQAIGADYYGNDARAAVAIAKKTLG